MGNVLIQMLRQVRFTIHIVPWEVVGDIFLDQISVVVVSVGAEKENGIVNNWARERYIRWWWIINRDIKNGPRREQTNKTLIESPHIPKEQTHVWGSGDTTWCFFVCPSRILISFMYSIAAAAATPTVSAVVMAWGCAKRRANREAAIFMTCYLATE